MSTPVAQTISRAERRRNFVLGVINGSVFEVSNAFLGFSTVIPVYLSRLTEAGWIIGFASTIPTAGWLLPQLFLARLWEHKPYKKPLYWLGTVIRLSMLLTVVAIVHFLSLDSPRAALPLFLVFLSLYSIGAGFCGLPFMEIISKTIASHQRSRFFSLRFFLGGIGAFFAGIAIRWILGSPDLFPYPANYATIFLISVTTMTVALGSFLLVREPKDERNEAYEPEGLIAYLGGSVAILRQDKRYMRYLLLRLCMAGVALSMPFYARHAIANLGAPEALVGTFVAAQTTGAILSNIIWGAIGDKMRKHVLIRITTALAFLVPLMALISTWIAGSVGTVVGTLAFTAMFPMIGAAGNGDFISNWGYLLEIIPDEKRSTYIGFTNTFGAVTSFLPILGGLMADWTSYPVVFTGSLLMLGAANIVAWSLPEIPRN